MAQYFKTSDVERDAIQWFYRALGAGLAAAGLGLILLDIFLLGQGTLFRVTCGLLLPAGGMMIWAGKSDDGASAKRPTDPTPAPDDTTEKPGSADP